MVTVIESHAGRIVGKDTQDDYNDAKVWLEPRIELAKAGRTLKQHEILEALRVVEQHHGYLLEAWHGFRRKAH